MFELRDVVESYYSPLAARSRYTTYRKRVIKPGLNFRFKILGFNFSFERRIYENNGLDKEINIFFIGLDTIVCSK